MDENAIAVIGLSCRFPGANGPEQFWANLVDGVDSITRYPDRRAATREYTPARGVLEAPEWFDAGYFGYAPREARIMSPQHRVFLECALEALESAGYDPDRYDGAIGVYAGGTETYYGQLLRAERHEIPGMTDWEILIGTAADFLVSRIAYKLGLRGPAVTVQAACATSLVAVHTATRALLSGDCDIALAGGVAIHVPQKDSPYVSGGIISADGKCRTFDAAADGTVGSDGAGMVVLKRLAEAIADGDHIRAVILGTAVNNDGADRIGYTAPSVAGQTAVILDALEVAGVAADTITMIEAHGTATPLGDPIEISALNQAFRESTERVGYCAIGSVKTNIGHTDAAAGIAGLIKAVLAVEQGIIPASLHFAHPNPQIPFDDSPFRVVTSSEKWDTGGIARRAGVSSFGIGGTNAHVVLEQPPPGRSSSSESDQLIVLSARTPEALDAVAAGLRSGASNADTAWTLQVGRRELPHRQYAIVGHNDDIASALANAVRNADKPVWRSPVFRFGTQPIEEIHAPQFVSLYRRCLAAMSQPPTPAEITVAQQYSLATLWITWGIEPAGLCGEGPGRLAALAVAGDITVPEAMALAVSGEQPTSDQVLAHVEGREVLDLSASATKGSMLPILGEFWLRGADIAWDHVHGGHRRNRVPLPTYPFERQRYVVEASSSAEPVPQQVNPPVMTQVPTAQLTAQIFAGMLDLPEVGPDDDFFDLGGDSLLGTYLLGEVHDALGVDLALESLYEAPTPQALALLVDRERA
ncbi:beta-ketoacyl synthase [Pseudonocardiaceae bacterium YIM PH 21723]|nr:beta-ketoacyl synthase [Pseudonocardiaceae bacterium YIM PH 21723]